MEAEENGPERIGKLESRWLRVGSHVLHTRVSASPPASPSPTVVLVHGLVISSLYMVPTAVRLAPFLPVYAPDLPGFGKSSKRTHVLTVPELAEALAAWMDAIGLRSAVLVGNSLGCQISVDLAVRDPSRVEAMVLAGPTMDPQARNAPQQIGRWLIDWTRERPSLAAAHVRDYYEAGLGRAWRTFRYAIEDRIEEKLPHVEAPTLVVRGAKDAIVPQRWVEEAASLLPRGELVVIPGGPHVVNYTTPLEFVRVIRGFLRRLGWQHASRD